MTSKTRRRATVGRVFGHQGSRVRLKDQRAFVRAVNTLNDLMERVCEYEPEANFYMACDSLNLMIGPSHDETRTHIGSGGQPQQGNIGLSWPIDNADCGDW